MSNHAAGCQRLASFFTDRDGDVNSLHVYRKVEDGGKELICKSQFDI